jgi:mono/diheme cytochrome c family protein
MGLVLLATLGGPAASQAQAAGALGSRSVLDSVYTADQATQGKALFEQLCLRCHAPVDFANERFQAKWTTRSLHDLYSVISRTMPLDQPGSLRPPQYAEVLAYVLSVNGYPAGRTELGWDRDRLSGIRIDPPRKSVP